MLDHFTLSVRYGIGRLEQWLWLGTLCGPTARYPQRERHYREVCSHKHRTRKVRSDADEAVRLHQQIQEEALVEVLHEIVQAAEQALDDAAERHVILPAAAVRLKCYRINMERQKAAVRASRLAKALPHHPPPDGL